MEKPLLINLIFLIVTLAIVAYLMSRSDMVSSHSSKVRVRTDDPDKRRLPEPSQEEQDGDAVTLIGLIMASVIMFILAQALGRM